MTEQHIPEAWYRYRTKLYNYLSKNGASTRAEMSDVLFRSVSTVESILSWIRHDTELSWTVDYSPSGNPDSAQQKRFVIKDRNPAAGHVLGDTEKEGAVNALQNALKRVQGLRQFSQITLTTAAPQEQPKFRAIVKSAGRLVEDIDDLLKLIA